MIVLLKHEFHNYGTFAKRVVDLRQIGDNPTANYDQLAEVAGIVDGLMTIVELPDCEQMKEALNKKNIPYATIIHVETYRLNGKLLSLSVDLVQANEQDQEACSIADFDNHMDFMAIAFLNLLEKHVEERAQYISALNDLPTKVSAEGEEDSPLGHAMAGLMVWHTGQCALNQITVPIHRIKNIEGVRDLMTKCHFRYKKGESI